MNSLFTRSFYTRWNRVGRLFAQGMSEGIDLHPKTCYYRVLGVGVRSSPGEIRKAYGAMVKLYHPDLNPKPEAVEKFKAISTAYEILADEDKRKLYDEAIGVSDLDWRKVDKNSPTMRFWTGNHQALLEEEVKRETVRLMPQSRTADSWGKKQQQKTEIPAGDNKQIQGEEYKPASQEELRKRYQGEKEEHVCMVGDKKESAEVLYEYFKNKYIKNPDVETRNAEDQLNFSWKIHEKTERRMQARHDNYTVYDAGFMNRRVEKKSDEAAIESVPGSVFKRLFPVVLVGGTFGVLYLFMINMRNEDASQSKTKHVIRGEGYVQKVAPI